MLSKTQLLFVNIQISRWKCRMAFLLNKRMKRLRSQKRKETWKYESSLKSLFSEVNRLLNAPQFSPTDEHRSEKKVPFRASTQTLNAPREPVTQFRKIAVFLASAFVLLLFEKCALLFSKRPWNTVACCFETYRMWREGESWEPFVNLCIYFCDIHNNEDAKAENPAGGNIWECLYLGRKSSKLRLWSAS